jgi:hypothetical protein
MKLLSDTRGKASWHITLGVIWTTIFSIKALISGIALTSSLGSVTTASFPGAEYLLFITPWLSAMGVREWIEKTKGSDASNS